MKLHLSLLALAAAAAASAAPFQNGSFELGPTAPYYEATGGDTTVTGWVGTNSGFEWFTPAAYGTGSADSGVAIVDLANYTFNNGGIAQTFDTTPGQSYSVSFAGSSSTASGRSGTADIVVTAPGFVNTYTVTNNSSNSLLWQNFGFAFTATAATSTLEFANYEDAFTHFAFVDSVSVQAVPEPGAFAALGLGALGLLRRKRRA